MANCLLGGCAVRFVELGLGFDRHLSRLDLGGQLWIILGRVGYLLRAKKFRQATLFCLGLLEDRCRFGAGFLEHFSEQIRDRTN